jgi:hypothetical protein
MSVQGALLAQLEGSVRALVAEALADVGKELEQLRAKVAELEKVAKPSAAPAKKAAAPSVKAHASTAEAKGTANP